MGNAGLTVQLIRFSSGQFAFSNFIASSARELRSPARAASNWRRPSYRIDLNNTPIAKSAVPPFTILATHTRA
jgi:hypothetical protein